MVRARGPPLVVREVRVAAAQPHASHHIIISLSLSLPYSPSSPTVTRRPHSLLTCMYVCIPFGRIAARVVVVSALHASFSFPTLFARYAVRRGLLHSTKKKTTPRNQVSLFVFYRRLTHFGMKHFMNVPLLTGTLELRLQGCAHPKPPQNLTKLPRLTVLHRFLQQTSSFPTPPLSYPHI
jgi:hypothetical protein